MDAAILMYMSSFLTLIILSLLVATVYAVKSAGLAIGIGVGSSFIVLISFTWGVRSKYGI